MSHPSVGPVTPPAMASLSALRETVRARYGEAARRVSDGQAASCCGPATESSGCCGATTHRWDPITANLYDEGQAAGLPLEALLASLGCANPTALADLREGEAVLDLGSGGGIDLLLSAKRVGPTGMAYGLDMTDDMLELANENKRRAGATNVEFLRGHIESIPLPRNSIDVIRQGTRKSPSPDDKERLMTAPLNATATLRLASPDDEPAVEALLTNAKLPLDGVHDALPCFIVADVAGEIVGVAGVQACGTRGEHALLRSVAVTPAWQSRGLGRALVTRTIAAAEARGVKALYLLTTTAGGYFPTFGFSVTPREAVPDDVRATEEFLHACPSSATVMVRQSGLATMSPGSTTP